MGRGGRRALLTLLLASVFPSRSRGAEVTVAIIVHPSNPRNNISFLDLVQVLKMDTQHWPGGGRIYLVLQESGTREKAMVLKRLYRMKESEVRQHYLGKLYRGEIASYPRIAHSNESVRRIVAQAPNALGFIDAEAVDVTVKTLRIDGKRPGDAGYLLAAAPE
jgi:hypothetical protein